MPDKARVTPAWRRRSDGKWGMQRPRPFAPKSKGAQKIMRAMEASAALHRAELEDVLRVSFRRGKAKEARDLAIWGAVECLKVRINEVAEFFKFENEDTAVVTLARVQRALLQNEELMALSQALRDALAKDESDEEAE